MVEKSKSDSPFNEDIATAPFYVILNKVNGIKYNAGTINSMEDIVWKSLNIKHCLRMQKAFGAVRLIQWHFKTN